MNFKGIYDSASEKDIFLVNTTRNMAKPKIISKDFGLTMRNLNDKEHYCPKKLPHRFS